MNQLNTTGIILSRTDFGEADRILTLLTPEYGKLRLVAKGVRRVKSKLAGGIELFSISHITFIRGRGDMGTLVSTRLVKHYAGIVKDLQRTMLGYDLIKQLNKVTEDAPESDYFDLLQQTFEALDDVSISLPLVQFWFATQLLRLAGHTPNLQTDTAGQKLDPTKTYTFDFDSMAFTPHDRGQFTADRIKFLRLSFAGNSAKVLAQVQGSQTLVEACTPLVSTMRATYLRV
ncbi:MAG TPA: DNA repair protein RecO [Candidatus Saccharimonadales bacterium]|jgi:DNA repair protein RecO (recombination protein O)|nr:DNA repair protein RecO [Candidatus Saccharimonadales bacterium]